MLCPQCDAELNPTALDCPSCGHRNESAEGAVATLPAAQEDDHAGGDVELLGIPDVPSPDDELLPPHDLTAVEAEATREWPLDAVVPGEETPHAPLVVGDVIGERYRVSRVFRDATGPVYEIVDPVAAATCWSCDTPWDTQADDDFCEKCGAERLEVALFVREQILSPAMLAEAMTMAPNALVSGDRLFIMGDFDPSRADMVDDIAVQTSDHQPDPHLHQPEADPGDTAPSGASEALPPNVLKDREQNDAPTIEAPLFEVFATGPHDPVGIRVGIASDVGRARRGRPNEDTALTITLAHAGDAVPAPLTLCIVADGLGGHEDGQRAGRLAARIVASYVTAHLWLPSLAGLHSAPVDAATLGSILRAAILTANAHILELNRTEGGDMGCTITTLLAQGDVACIANVGDSRTYHFDGLELQRVTTDHSLVARLVTAGMLTPEEVYTHPQRSQIYRSLGDEGDLVVDVFPHLLRGGEMFVLCSDGLWEMVRDPIIENVLSTYPDRAPQALATQLVELANEHGGEDNVTVLVAQVVS